LLSNLLLICLLIIKKNWKHPAKGEYPKNGSQIIVKCDNTDNTLCAEYIFDKFVRINTTTELIGKVIAWCELPTYNA